MPSWQTTRLQWRSITWKIQRSIQQCLPSLLFCNPLCEKRDGWSTLPLAHPMWSGGGPYKQISEQWECQREWWHWIAEHSAQMRRAQMQNSADWLMKCRLNCWTWFKIPLENNGLRWFILDRSKTIRLLIFVQQCQGCCDMALQKERGAFENWWFAIFYNHLLILL